MWHIAQENWYLRIFIRGQLIQHNDNNINIPTSHKNQSMALSTLSIYVTQLLRDDANRKGQWTVIFERSYKFLKLQIFRI